jgi:hypothetical protein
VVADAQTSRRTSRRDAVTHCVLIGSEEAPLIRSHKGYLTDMALQALFMPKLYYFRKKVSDAVRSVITGLEAAAAK